MKLYCIGDSLIFGYGVPRSVCWVRQLEQRQQRKTVNMGVNGDTTAGIRRRLEELLPFSPEEQRDAAVLLMGGYNDIFRTGSDAQARENMAAMLESLQSREISTYVLIPPGIGSGGFPPEWEETIDFDNARRVVEDYSKWLLSLCAKRGVSCLDLRGVVDRDRYLSDGVHPDAEAQKLIADAVEEIL